MKSFILTILIIWTLTASVAAQNVKTLPSPSAKISKSTVNKPEKMLFSGTIKERYFEMTLTRAGENLRGNYFFAQSGAKSALQLRGKIDAIGSVVLREFDTANKRTGEFRGELVENAEDYDLNFTGVWKNGARRKSLNF